jgi:zinc transporter, ZIP family
MPAETLTWFRDAPTLLQALLAGSFTLVITAAGAALVVLSRSVSQKLLDAMLGFAAGVMLAASFWSLLAPAITLAEQQGQPGWFPAAVGFVAGAAFLRLADLLLPHLHPRQPLERAEGISTAWQRSTLLVLAITLHNIPEGLALGVSFGAAAIEAPSGAGAGYSAAVALTLGIGIQNFPEGVAVALPLRAAGISRLRSFAYGTASALVEPVAAVIGAAAVLSVQPLLPYALAFAAGAMVFVVVEELIPEAHHGNRADLATSAAILGFTVMMTLDVAIS